jgi:hypothetical protein
VEASRHTDAVEVVAQQADTAIAAAWPPRSVSPMVSDQSLARDSTTDGSSSSHAASPSATTLLRKP